jgi:polyisoprenoid-binding protein YceI
VKTRLLLALALAAASRPAAAADYVQGPGSSLTFATTYQGTVFTGRFAAFTTRLSFDPARPAASRLEVGITLAGAATGDDERDSTLATADFFDVARHPQARFVATRFRALGGNRWAADGQLTLRGVSRPVTLAFTWTPGPRPVLEGRATLRRLDFGVGGGEWADTSLIPNEVAVGTRVVLQPAK